MAEASLTGYQQDRLDAYDVRDFGAVDTDGVTDSSIAVLAAIDAAYDNGGGVLLFPAGTIRIDSQLALPNDDNAKPRQPPLTFRGAGAVWDGKMTSGDMPGATVLDLRSTSGPAKIDSRGAGKLTIEHLTLTQSGSAVDTNPFVQVTNTTLHVRDVSVIGHSTLNNATCVQDAFVLGGTVDLAGKLATSAFQGYGTIIERCLFHRIRRGVYGRVWCNSVVIQNNTWTNACGSGDTTPAIEIDGSTGFAWGNVLYGNLIEMTGYSHGVRFRQSQRNIAWGNSFWDAEAGDVAYHLQDDGVGNNACYRNLLHAIITGGITADDVVQDDAGATEYTLLNNSVLQGVKLSGSPTLVQPEESGASEFQGVLHLKRSANEESNAGSNVLIVQQNGQMYLGDSWSSVARLSVRNSGALTNFDHSAIVRTTAGHFDLYAGTGANDGVRVRRGFLGLPTTTTAGRPTASSVGAGACMFDTDLGKPIFSDGTGWVDATGTSA